MGGPESGSAKSYLSAERLIVAAANAHEQVDEPCAVPGDKLRELTRKGCACIPLDCRARRGSSPSSIIARVAASLESLDTAANFTGA